MAHGIVFNCDHGIIQELKKGRHGYSAGQCIDCNTRLSINVSLYTETKDKSGAVFYISNRLPRPDALL